MIAVTFALPVESSELVRLLQNQRREKQGGVEVVRGALHGHAVAVLHTGVGEKATRTRLGSFLGAAQPSALISAGFAGALNDSLGIGDLLLADNRTAPTLLPPAQRALAPDGVKVGALTTAHDVIDSSAKRQKLAEDTGAAAVDMETEFIEELCANLVIPMVSLRAITDTPHVPFPAPPQVLFNVERQRSEFGPLFRYLLFHPAAMPKFISFARNIARCRSILTSALDLLLPRLSSS